ncbi:Myb family transcription factor APL [Morus notabilis]|uniref:Myb family transcription factor APL n=1 Tax=Morus notabilis TaxID=981085 RepID=W9RIH6_9ROSA|nr:Myb family transcription factor APL [Morus notabilis]
MNDHKIACQGRNQVQQNHGLKITDRSFEFVPRSSHLFGVQNHPENMGIWTRQQPCTMDNQARLSQLQNLVSPVNNNNNNNNSDKSSSSTIMISCFESPASAFYATERCMRFAEYDSQVCYDNPSLNSHFSSGHQSSAENYSIDTNDQSEPNFEFRNSLQPMVKPHPSFGHDQRNKLHIDTATTASSIRRQFSVPSKENQDLGLNFACHQEKQSPRFSSGNGCISTITLNTASTGPGISSKTRIRWTQDLHEKFVECVNRLGGAEKATPKAILKLMDSEGLTIYHIKSHLQKYRIAKYLPDSSEGKSEKRACINVTPQLEATTGLQIKEALQLQLDVQRRLHEQLEIQRNLQLQIEEQGRQLKMMFDKQQRKSNSLFKSQCSAITSPDLDHDHDDDYDDAPSNNGIDEVQVSIAEASGNTNFPSKIS